MNTKTFITRYTKAKTAQAAFGQMLLEMELEQATPEVKLQLVAKVNSSRLTPEQKNAALLTIQTNKVG